MPLPAAWVAMSNVGAARGQGSDFAARANAQVHCLFWRSQSAHRQIRPSHVLGFQCRDVPAVSRAVAASSNPSASHDYRARQRSLSSRRPPGSILAPALCSVATALLAALQPATRLDRARMEADPPVGNSQPLLSNARSGGGGGQHMLQPLAAAEFSLTKTMLHYLGRPV